LFFFHFCFSVITSIYVFNGFLISSIPLRGHGNKFVNQNILFHIFSGKNIIFIILYNSVFKEGSVFALIDDDPNLETTA
jgi:hypothetical protein